MNHRRWPLVAALFLPAVLAQTEPTAEETAVLCWVNRFRRDPQAFARFIVDGNQPANTSHVDWQLFAAEVAALKAAPPLFFEPRLIDASRAHARYMIAAKEYGHHETAGRPGFTGASPTDRARAAGYGSPVAECAWARGETPLGIVAGYVVDAGAPGAGSGGMQAGRGHRRCLIDPTHREAGVGLVPWGDRQRSNVLLFGGVPGGTRVLGGVAIDDRNRDHAYDVGEGLGDVHVVVGDRCTVSSASGAWRLDLTAPAPKKLVARLGSLTVERPIAAGAEDLQIDLEFDVPRALADLDRRLAALPEGAAAQRRALRLERLELRPPATAEETELADEVARTKAAVLARLGTWSRQEAEASLQTAKRAFAGTVVEAWIRQAQILDPLARTAAAVRAHKPGAERGKQARALVSDIERQLVGVTNADLWRVLARLRSELLAW